MKDTSAYITDYSLTQIYVTYRALVYRYIFRRLNGCIETEDLVQDAFLRLLEYRSMLRSDTIRSFLYTIVRNLITDYLRRHYKTQEVMSCMQEDGSIFTTDVESLVYVKELSVQEQVVLHRLSSKVRDVYCKSRFEEKTASEISVELNIPKRTVEGYLLTGRKMVREYMKQCI